MKTSKRENKGGEPNPQWTSIEVVRYYLFMMLKMQDILAFHRKTRNIFKEMSAFVTSRTQEQCKSHHQKKAITHRNIKTKLIQFIEEEYRARLFD